MEYSVNLALSLRTCKITDDSSPWLTLLDWVGGGINNMEKYICKFLTGANKYSSNLACKSEVGRYPLAIIATFLSIKYWMHINDDEILEAQNKFTFQSLINGDEIKSN